MSDSTLEQRFQDLLEIQRDVPTTWSLRQRDVLDRTTSFIYRCKTLSDVRKNCKSSNLNNDTQSYALHRWKNFVRHDAWLDLTLATIPGARPFEDPKDRTRDLYLSLDSGETVFDLKVTRWPSRLEKSSSLQQVAEWMYLNQSQQGRHHVENRLFVVGINELILCDIDAAHRNILSFWKQRKSHVFQLSLAGSRPTAGVLHIQN